MLGGLAPEGFFLGGLFPGGFCRGADGRGACCRGLFSGYLKFDICTNLNF